jgi:cytochrome b subunit of formate dehydrogenase
MRSHKLPYLLALFLFLAGGSMAVAQEDEDCLSCHGDAALFEGRPGAERLFVAADALAGSVHADAGISCVYCHQSLVGVEDFPHEAKLKPVNCGGCHREEKKVFNESLHGYSLKRGNKRAPSCATCHGGHQVLPSSDPASATHKVNVPDTCAKCHGQAGLLTDQIVKLPESFKDYAQSVHGKAAARGVGKAASCADCHEIHDLKSAANPESPINPRNQADTCGKCHPDIRLKYQGSIHGRAVNAGVSDSPTCTDCHGEHLILSPRDPAAKTHAGRIATETCGRCHDDPIIVAKYNLQGGVVGSYVDSYHGWATRRNDPHAATCVSCHTAHSVLPAADPASTVAPENVVATCAQCHPQATPNFARSYTHEAASISANPINRWIRTAYLGMIALVIGGMVVHNLIIMNYFMIKRRREQAASKWLLRFDRSQVFQHMLLIVSFTLLVVTGFALRFPEAWWVQQVTALGMSETVRGFLHRFGAVVLVITALSHIYYVLLTRRGRSELRAIAPALRDTGELIGNMKYYTFRSDQKVKFSRYDYSQKAEYWALIWGTILMIFTGVVLWFPEVAVKYFPSWIIGASQTVHYYEAWLATLAILIWHFFFVIFHPEEYPMSWTWLTGKMSEESVKEHHLGWYEEEQARLAAEEEANGPKED